MLARRIWTLRNKQLTMVGRKQRGKMRIKLLNNYFNLQNTGVWLEMCLLKLIVPLMLFCWVLSFVTWQNVPIPTAKFVFVELKIKSTVMSKTLQLQCTLFFTLSLSLFHHIRGHHTSCLPPGNRMWELPVLLLLPGERETIDDWLHFGCRKYKYHLTIWLSVKLKKIKSYISPFDRV